MLKSKAIELLGGTIVAAAEVIGVSYQAINQWPEELPKRIADRVLAALARQHLPASLIGDEHICKERRTSDRRVQTDRRATKQVQGV